MTTTQYATDPGSIAATRTLAEFAAAMRTADMQPELWQKAGVCLLDALGLGLDAAAEHTTRSASGLFPVLAPGSGVHVWPTGNESSVLDAVLANGVAVHAYFQDDCDMTSWSHPGSLIAPVAVGLAEHAGATVQTALRAMVAGYTALNWLGAHEEVGRAVVARGFRASPTLGPVAAAVAGAVAVGLDADAAQSAIGIAADMSGGTLEPVRTGAANWRVQNGSAAWRGALAVLLARLGVAGSTTALEGERGFVRAFAGKAAPPQWSCVPDPRTMLTVWEKKFPTLGDNIAVTLAACELHSRDVDLESVEEIIVHQNAEFASYPGTSYRGPFDRPAQAMASTAWAVVEALTAGEIRVHAYDDIARPTRFFDLISRLRVVPEPQYRYTDGMVELRTSTGVERVSCRDLPETQLFRDAGEARRIFLSRAEQFIDKQAALDDLTAVAESILDAEDAASSAAGSLRRSLDRLPRPTGRSGD